MLMRDGQERRVKNGVRPMWRICQMVVSSPAPVALLIHRRQGNRRFGSARPPPGRCAHY